MTDHNDILSGLAPTDEPASLPVFEVEATLAEMRADLLRAKKKLKKAKRKGKGGKKLRRRIKKLKSKSRKLKRQLQYIAAQPPYRGRWDSLLEKSVPEAIKLANTIVQQRSPQPAHQVVYVHNKEYTKRQPQNQPQHLPPRQPVFYLPSPPAEEE